MANAIDANAHVIRATLGLAPMTGAGVSIETRRRVDREFQSDETSELWGVKPGLKLNKGMVSAAFTTNLTWVSALESAHVSPLLAEGRPIGFSVTQAAELRIQFPPRISLNARFSGDHRPEESDRWRTQIESVAQF
jgi:hypothetical protein